MQNPNSEEILIVEDDENAAKLLANRLANAGYRVHEEAYGEAALEYARKNWPSLIIIDLGLPDMSGFQVSADMCKLFEPIKVPILMLTAMDRPAAELRGFVSGANAYMTKPFDTEKLLETVTQLIAEAKSRETS